MRNPVRQGQQRHTAVAEQNGVIGGLLEELTKLPGIGPKSAERIAHFLLSDDRHHAVALAEALRAVADRVHSCRECFNFTDAELCPICRDPRRDGAVLCVVETPRDVGSFERAGSFRGRYHVLHGAISPVDGIGPDRLRIRELLDRVSERAADGEPFEEVILATNPTLEGEATAMYVAERLTGQVGSVSRIARGIPVGGDLEYADEVTLVRAIQGRHELAVARRP